MNRINFVLGWICIIGVPLLFITVMVLFAIGQGSMMAVKLIWMPFVLLWGLRQVKKYREAQFIAMINKGLKEKGYGELQIVKPEE